MTEESSSSSSTAELNGADPAIATNGDVGIAFPVEGTEATTQEAPAQAAIGTGAGATETSTDDRPQFTTIDEADRHLPVANISRIMKKVLPTNAQVSKDTKSYIQLCVSEFISFITSEASDKCMQEKRKTINGDVSSVFVYTMFDIKYVLRKCIHYLLNQSFITIIYIYACIHSYHYPSFPSNVLSRTFYGL